MSDDPIRAHSFAHPEPVEGVPALGRKAFSSLTLSLSKGLSWLAGMSLSEDSDVA